MQRFSGLALFLAIAILVSVRPALAQDQAPAAKPAPASQPGPQASAKSSPVVVEHTGADPVGTALANACREAFARSALFRMSKTDERKFVVAVQTREEFPDRPRMASLVTVLWLFSAQDGTLRFFLQSDTSSVDAAGVEDTVNRILAKTDSVATTYKSLFE